MQINWLKNVHGKESYGSSDIDFSMNSNQTPQKPGPGRDRDSANESLVMAWARDRDTGELRYILEVKETGAKCNCQCISCGEPLTAINAKKELFVRRPHFRHPNGTHKESCEVLVARAAMAALFRSAEILYLPRRRRHAQVEGFSGKLYDAWVETPAEKVKIIDVRFADSLRGTLTLEDGRKIEVHLIGSMNTSESSESSAHIEVLFDEVSVVSMSLEEIRKKIVPLIDEHCWKGHWNDELMDAKALSAAYDEAKNFLDWDEECEMTPEATPSMRRETLLHKLVKNILLNSKLLVLPAFETVIAGREIFGNFIERRQEFPSRWAHLSNVTLERRMGRIVPDVIAIEDDGSTLFVEVTVTNTIDEERKLRIIGERTPAIEINIGLMGGTITYVGLVDLVVNKVAGKRWLCHPAAIYSLTQLELELDEEYRRQEELGRIYEQMALKEPVETWVALFIDTAQLMFRSRQVALQRHSAEFDRHEEELDAIGKALEYYGYPEARDRNLYGSPNRLLERILSIKTDAGVGFAESSCWEVINHIRLDKNSQLEWHTLYLIAIRVYKPKLNHLQEESIQKWRNLVKLNFLVGKPHYIRSQKYDRFIALLFPEMAELIKRSRNMAKHGNTPSEISSSHVPVVINEDSGIRNEIARSYGQYDKTTRFFRGAELERWKRNNPEWADAWPQLKNIIKSK